VPFVFDIFLLMYVPVLGRDTAWHIWMTVKFQPWASYVGMLMLLNCLHFLVLFIAMIYRFMIWHTANTIGSDLTPQQFFDEMLGYQDLFETSRIWYIGALWITWVRVIEYLRDNARMNAVTETVRLAATDLFSLLLVTGIILFTFALVGSTLYGRHVFEFRTLGASMDFLTRTLFTADVGGEEDAYNEMKALEPIWTPFFILLYFGLSWLILLNVVLGILATGFSAASQSTRDRSWDIDNIRTESWYFLRKRCWCCCGVGKVGFTELAWPFTSGYFVRRMEACGQLGIVLAELEKAYEVDDGEDKGTKEPLDQNVLRKTKFEYLEYSQSPDFGMNAAETARAFEECMDWWRGSLSDIASQQQSEREQLRNSILDLTRRINRLSKDDEERFQKLLTNNTDQARTIVDDVRGNASSLHGRHDRTQRSLEDVIVRLGNYTGPKTPGEAPVSVTASRAVDVAPAAVTYPVSTPVSPTTPEAAVPGTLPGVGTAAEALYRGEWLPCSLLAHRPDGLYLIAWNDGTWTDGVQPDHIRAPVQ